MRVHLVPMRRFGVKLAADVVASATPMLGELTITSTFGVDQHGSRWTSTRAQFSSGPKDDALMHLANARITRMPRGDSFLIVGVEVRIPKHIGSSERLPQAWACRVALPDDPEADGVRAYVSEQGICATMLSRLPLHHESVPGLTLSEIDEHGIASPRACDNK